MDSILTSIKKMLGITEEYTHFDQELIIYINSALMILTQIGVGPADGYVVEDAEDRWSDFIVKKQDLQRMRAIESYVYMRVKLVFDPPPSSATVQAMENQIRELEFRLNIAGESKQTTIKEENQNEK